MEHQHVKCMHTLKNPRKYLFTEIPPRPKYIEGSNEMGLYIIFYGWKKSFVVTIITI